MAVKTDTRLEINALAIIADVAKERSASDIAAEAQEVRAALLAGRFNVAVVGQFKRGKSTLINALIGRELLPSDIAPITSTITVLQHGHSERCLIIYADGREEEVPISDLRLYASEESNPGNQMGVRIILIELSVPLLESGLRLVDTPGVGSVFEPNSETTRSFLPRIDVAVVVLGSDPPITGDELELVKSLSQRAERFCFIMNKSDMVSEPNRQRAEVFTRKVLSPVLAADPIEIIHVSALSALQEEADVGIDRLRRILSEMAAHSGQELSRRSAAQASTYLAGRLIRQIDLEREGLIEPLARLDANIDRFSGAMKDIDDLMLASKVRVEKEGTLDFRALTRQKEEFLSEKTNLILQAVDEKVASLGGGKRHIRDQMLEIARLETKRRIEEWQSLASGRYEDFYGCRLKTATHELNRLTSRVSGAATEAFGIAIPHFEIQYLKSAARIVSFEFSQPALALDVMDLLVPLGNIILPRKAIARLTFKRIGTLVQGWLMKNTYQVDEALTLWLDKATRQLTHVMCERLDSLKREIMDAVSKGRKERDIGTAAVAERLKALETQRARLVEIAKIEGQANDIN
jgi:GTP-binding protein EngB required for normal cell division